MQLCVDAGIPLNNHLLGQLIKDVIIEKVQSLLGHPKRPQTPLKMVGSLLFSFFYLYHVLPRLACSQTYEFLRDFL